MANFIAPPAPPPERTMPAPVYTLELDADEAKAIFALVNCCRASDKGSGEADRASTRVFKAMTDEIKDNLGRMSEDKYELSRWPQWASND